jgi:hypothetical protein
MNWQGFGRMTEVLTRYWPAGAEETFLLCGRMIDEYEFEMTWKEEVGVAYSPGTGPKGLRKTTTPDS